MKLNAQNVHAVLMDCLFNEGEDTSKHVVGDGVMQKLGFHPDRLQDHKSDIESMADQLPDEFKKSYGMGVGASFLNAFMTQDGDHWGEHSNIDELLCLAMAVGKISLPFPRDSWGTLPGGMPFLIVN